MLAVELSAALVACTGLVVHDSYRSSPVVGLVTITCVSPPEMVKRGKHIFSFLKVLNPLIISESDLIYLRLNLVSLTYSGKLLGVIPCPANRCLISGLRGPIG
jgi:hypothetical protein